MELRFLGNELVRLVGGNLRMEAMRGMSLQEE